MGRGINIPWVGGRYTMGREINIPWVGGQNTMVREGVPFILIMMGRG
jgi:hypothetical protein